VILVTAANGNQGKLLIPKLLATGGQLRACVAVGAEVGLGAILIAWLLANQHLGIPAAIALSLVAGAALGVFSWLMIIRARIPAFIATLGVGSVLTAVITWVSGSEQIENLPLGFTTLGTGQLFGITYPVYIMLVVSVLLWYVLERTPVGRRSTPPAATPQPHRWPGSARRESSCWHWSRAGWSAASPDCWKPPSSLQATQPSAPATSSR